MSLIHGSGNNYGRLWCKMNCRQNDAPQTPSVWMRVSSKKHLKHNEQFRAETQSGYVTLGLCLVWGFALPRPTRCDPLNSQGIGAVVGARKGGCGGGRTVPKQYLHCKYKWKSKIVNAKFARPMAVQPRLEKTKNLPGTTRALPEGTNPPARNLGISKIIWSCGRMIRWSYDRMVEWSCDRMIIWSSDHVTILWSCDHMIMRSYDHVNIWSYGQMIL